MCSSSIDDLRMVRCQRLVFRLLCIHSSHIKDRGFSRVRSPIKPVPLYFNVNNLVYSMLYFTHPPWCRVSYFPNWVSSETSSTNPTEHLTNPFFFFLPSMFTGNVLSDTNLSDLVDTISLSTLSKTSGTVLDRFIRSEIRYPLSSVTT